MNDLNKPGERAGDATLEQLLREAGIRETPPPDLTREVREAAHRAWRDVVDQRTRRRRLQVFSAAASVAALTLVAGTAVLQSPDPDDAIAAVGRIEGSVTRDAGLWHAARALAPESVVYVGDEIATADESRAAFHIGDGLSVRLDARSRLRLVTADRVRLERGAIYIDAAPSIALSTDLVVETRAGDVRHLGTQYEVRSTDAAVRISVREGRVAVQSHGALLEASAGELIAIKENGTVARSSVAPTDPQWEWITQVAPRFDIEGKPLSAFLEWWARETGYSLEYATAQAEQEAQQTTLRGSIEGLEPLAALRAVLATTNLQASSAGEHTHTLVISSGD